MDNSLIKYLTDQPFMTVVRGLMCSSQPRHIRDLATRYRLSPAGVSDIIRRLKILGVLKESAHKNRKCFSLILSDAERRCLKMWLTCYDDLILKQRAIRFSRGAKEKLAWMDQSYCEYRSIKSRLQKNSRIRAS
jgi:hypothetical protein